MRSAPVRVEQAEDVHPVIGQRPADVHEQTAPVESLDLDRGHEMAGDVGVPLDLDQALTLGGGQRHCIGAIVSMHRHAAAAGDETHDLVARHGRAALRQTDEDVVETLDVYTHPGPLGIGPPSGTPDGGRQVVFAGRADIGERFLDAAR